MITEKNIETLSRIPERVYRILTSCGHIRESDFTIVDWIMESESDGLLYLAKRISHSSRIMALPMQTSIETSYDYFKQATRSNVIFKGDCPSGNASLDVYIGRSCACAYDSLREMKQLPLDMLQTGSIYLFLDANPSLCLVLDNLLPQLGLSASRIRKTGDLSTWGDVDTRVKDLRMALKGPLGIPEGLEERLHILPVRTDYAGRVKRDI